LITLIINFYCCLKDKENIEPFVDVSYFLASGQHEVLTPPIEAGTTVTDPVIIDNNDFEVRYNINYYFKNLHQLHFTGIVIDHSISITQNKCLNIVIDYSIGITQYCDRVQYRHNPIL
jgi:hypothetical protein